MAKSWRKAHETLEMPGSDAPMKGRKPKPTHLKLITSNPGKRPLNAAEPRPRTVLSAAPHWFSKDHREAWHYALAHSPFGMLKGLDRGVLTVWVCASVIHRAAVEQQLVLDAKPRARRFLSRGRRGRYKLSPYLRIISQQSQIMLRAAAELGFTPASRPRIDVPPGGGGENGASDRYGL